MQTCDSSLCSESLYMGGFMSVGQKLRRVWFLVIVLDATLLAVERAPALVFDVVMAVQVIGYVLLRTYGPS